MPKQSSMTLEQRAFVQRVMAELSVSFPDLTAKQIVAGPLAEFTHGLLPSYSNLSAHNVTNVSSAMVGSFVICHAIEPDTKETVVVMIKRGDKGPNGEDRFGVTGGYTDLDSTAASTFTAASHVGEQPAQGAVRELREELLDANGSAILDIDPQRLSIIKTGIDYRQVAKGGLATQYNGHAVGLTAEEFDRVQQHVQKLASDPDYKKAVETKSGGEVSNVIIVKLADAIKMDGGQFTHPHELEAIKLLSSALEPKLGARVLSTTPTPLSL